MLAQSFGAENTTNEADCLTCVEFDQSGQYLATGDAGGRVVLFSRTPQPTKSRGTRKDKETSPGNDERRAKRRASKAFWKPYFQFQSHEQSFDFLKSLPIEERVNKIEFLPPVQGGVVMLTANDKTVKLWKVTHRAAHTPRAVDSLKHAEWRADRKGGVVSPACLHLPTRATGTGCVPSAHLRRTYDHAHAYNVNALSANSDGRTFLSADDLRVHWWDLEVADKCFNVVDLKPKAVEELTEVLTAARFHPQHCHTFAYGTSKGHVHVADTRVRALCDGPGGTRRLQSFLAPPSSRPPYRYPSHPALPGVGTGTGTDALLTEMVGAVSDLRYSHDGRFLVARDYLSVKIWDARMSHQPVRTIPVNGYLRAALPHLYDSGALFDRFGAVCSPDGARVLAGGYSNRFTVYDAATGSRVKDLPLPGAPAFYTTAAAVRAGLGLGLGALRPPVRAAFASVSVFHDEPAVAAGEGLGLGLGLSGDDCEESEGFTSVSSRSRSAASSFSSSCSEESLASPGSSEGGSDGSGPTDRPRGDGGGDYVVVGPLPPACPPSSPYMEEDEDEDDELRMIQETVARRPAPPLSPPTSPPSVAACHSDGGETGSGEAGGDKHALDLGSCTVRTDLKVLRAAWHPTDDLVAVAGKCGLYLYRF